MKNSVFYCLPAFSSAGICSFMEGEITTLMLLQVTLFSEADSAGADLRINSWGSSMSGMYTSYPQDADEYVWDNPDSLILFAAGNDGIDMDGDGVIDYYSMSSPEKRQGHSDEPIA